MHATTIAVRPRQQGAISGGFHRLIRALTAPAPAYIPVTDPALVPYGVARDEPTKKRTGMGFMQVRNPATTVRARILPQAAIFAATSGSKRGNARAFRR